MFPRTLKSITITPEMRAALGIAAGVAELSPAELISACLRAPVGLLWNGGIGTYVKATAESHAQVGDKANDGLRVNGSEVRARCVGEGGNLGLTQLGRIEYAMKGGESGHGGRINTDFIDNSAGVDTSDHEVNIKILLAGEVAAGRLTGPDRDDLLASMTDEVARLVLKHNYDQNLALASAVFQASSMAGVHEDWMERLEDRGILDRQIEFLPTAEELAARRRNQQGLSSPELSTLMSYTKIMLAREVLSSDLPDDPDLADRLVRYFPTPLRERYADQIREHRLSREIITTVLVNDFVNKAGITSYHRLSSETGASVADLIRANVAARLIFGAAESEAAIVALDHRVPAAVQTDQRLEVRTLVERATRWLVNNRRRPIDISATVDFYAQPVTALFGCSPTCCRVGTRRRTPRRSRAMWTRECRPSSPVGPRCSRTCSRPSPSCRRRARGAMTSRRWPACTSPSVSDSVSTGCSAGSSSCRAATGGRSWPARRCATTCTPCRATSPRRRWASVPPVRPSSGSRRGRRRRPGCRSRSRRCARSATASRTWPRPRSGCGWPGVCCRARVDLGRRGRCRAAW